MKPAIATINQQALRHNIELIKSFAPQQKLLAMIKANAYGQGLLPAAHALRDLVDGFGVARLREALEIQERSLAVLIPLFTAWSNLSY